MKQSFKFYFVFCCISLFANNGLCFDKGPIFISLGNNCWTAQALELAGLRNCAFPFDWLFTLDDEGLNKTFDDDFQYFTDANFFSPDNYSTVSVRNNYYGMVFTHDWPFLDNEINVDRHNQHLNAIKIKYERRIARLRQLRQYPGKVFFFRTFSTYQDVKHEPGWNTEKAKRLKNSLDLYFPNLDFTLVILSCSDAEVPETDKIDGVIEFKIRELYIQKNYQDMFNSLKLGSYTAHN